MWISPPCGGWMIRCFGGTHWFRLQDDWIWFTWFRWNQLNYPEFGESIYFRSVGTLNLLASNDVYIRRTAQLTSRRCILNIYSTNILTEYLKHAAHSRFFSLSSRCRLFHNATFFGSCSIHILNTGVLKFKRKFRRQRVKRHTMRKAVSRQEPWNPRRKL